MFPSRGKPWRSLSTCAIPKPTATFKMPGLQPTRLPAPTPDYRELLVSSIDPSLNMMRPFGKRGGELETRAVIRGPTFDKLCVYVSSHGGCNLGCQQCHLTHNRQTSMKPCTTQDYVKQVDDLMTQFVKTRPYSTDKLRRVTIEFMARGEPLENPTVRNRWPELYGALKDVFESHHKRSLPGVEPTAFKCHISTLMPKSYANGDLVKTFFPKENDMGPDWHDMLPVIYYSAWFLDPLVQQKWMPNALPVVTGLKKLGLYQSEIVRRFIKHSPTTPFSDDPWNDAMETAKTKVLLHRAFLNGLNDSPQELSDLLFWMKQKGVNARINSLRYSPPVNENGVPNEPTGQQETPEPRRSECLLFLKQNNPSGFKEIERAGEDVRASCGVFMPPLPPL